MSTEQSPVQPLLRVVSGSPTPQEIAVLTAVLAAASTGGAPFEPPLLHRGRWNDPVRSFRKRWLIGPGGWTSLVH
jgi:hypothetical protein